METKINIAAILKDKPQGTKLYSPIFGKLRYEGLVPDLGEFTIVTSDNTSAKYSFRQDSRYNRHGEPLMLLPSIEMRDWSKFAWKKGDVLVHKDGTVHIIFERFEDDTYRTFKGKWYLWEDNGHIEQFDDRQHCMETSVFIKANDDAKTYINTIEERLGGKLNRETLEIEPAQPEFKDGDIVCISGMGYLAYSIVKSIDYSSKKLEYYALNDMSTLKIDDWLSFEDKQIQPITETQQIILFDVLAKEGKAWDAEKKMIVDLKSLWTPKPFDKVLVRNSDADKWLAGFFEKFEKSWNNPYHIMNLHHMTDFAFKQCIPYEGNESLLGTTKDVEGEQ